MDDVRRLFGMRVIEASWLPRNIVLLNAGNRVHAWNIETGEVRSMLRPAPFVMTPPPSGEPGAEKGGDHGA